MKDAATLVEATVGVTPTDGNRVDVLRNGDRIFPAMLDAIHGAESSIGLLTYVYWQGDIAWEVARALAARARAGVQVRVLVDWVGGRTMARALVRELEDAGVSFAWFRPPGRVVRAAVSLDDGLTGQHRTHRKVLVVDGRIGFTGGVGIAEEWTGDARGPGEWRDTHVRIEGPAVTALTSAFATNWLEATGDALPAPTGPPEPAGDVRVQVVRGQPGRFVPDVALALRALMAEATQRIWIETAYFVPDDACTDLLVDAVRRGVDVRVLVPGPRIDKRVSQLAARASMGPLLEAGVRIHEYEPTMLHCKVTVVDDVGVTGSANLNMRSLRQDDEVLVVIHDADVADRLAADLEADMATSQRLDPDRFEERGPLHRFQESVTRLLRRVL